MRTVLVKTRGRWNSWCVCFPCYFTCSKLNLNLNRLKQRDMLHDIISSIWSLSAIPFRKLSLCKIHLMKITNNSYSFLLLLFFSHDATNSFKASSLRRASRGKIEKIFRDSKLYSTTENQWNRDTTTNENRACQGGRNFFSHSLIYSFIHYACTHFVFRLFSHVFIYRAVSI